ncbi:MAG: DUF4405 domain-containing protein [Myxococcales bacterium]
MKRIFQLSTPASAASFLVVGSTGVLMFLHVAQRELESLHEWAGLLMVVAASLHALRNGRALLAYARRGFSLQASLWVAGLLAAGFLLASFMGVERGGLDALRVRIENAPLVELAPVFDEEPTRLVARLQKAGLQEVTPAASPAQIAVASHRSSREVLEVLAATEQ